MPRRVIEKQLKIQNLEKNDQLLTALAQKKLKDKRLGSIDADEKLQEKVREKKTRGEKRQEK